MSHIFNLSGWLYCPSYSKKTAGLIALFLAEVFSMSSFLVAITLAFLNSANSTHAFCLFKLFDTCSFAVLIFLAVFNTALSLSFYADSLFQYIFLIFFLDKSIKFRVFHVGGIFIIIIVHYQSHVISIIKLFYQIY